MQILKYMAEHSHEQLCFFSDPETGLRAIVGIHDTTLGPALGGARMYPYEREQDALLDVLRLSEGMSYKSAMAGLPLGGGKCVIIGDPRTDKSPALFQALGRAIDKLAGRYITAEDVGISMADVIHVRETTPHVAGLPESMGGGGDPSPLTAIGVLRGIEACAMARWGNTELAGKRVAIQGLGKVGWVLAELLHERGASLLVSDVRQRVLQQAAEQFGATVVEPQEIYRAACDIFAPCAMGAILNDETIPQLRCALVAGSANNQLQSPRHGWQLMERDILYAPDYVINAGGVINVATELAPGGYDADLALERVHAIYDNVASVIDLARAEQVPTSVAADRVARQRIAEAKGQPIESRLAL